MLPRRASLWQLEHAVECMEAVTQPRTLIEALRNNEVREFPRDDDEGCPSASAAAAAAAGSSDGSTSFTDVLTVNSACVLDPRKGYDAHDIIRTSLVRERARGNTDVERFEVVVTLHGKKHTIHLAGPFRPERHLEKDKEKGVYSLVQTYKVSSPHWKVATLIHEGKDTRLGAVRAYSAYRTPPSTSDLPWKLISSRAALLLHLSLDDASLDGTMRRPRLGLPWFSKVDSVGVVLTWGIHERDQPAWIKVSEDKLHIAELSKTAEEHEEDLRAAAAAVVDHSSDVSRLVNTSALEEALSSKAALPDLLDICDKTISAALKAKDYWFASTQLLFGDCTIVTHVDVQKLYDFTRASEDHAAESGRERLCSLWETGRDDKHKGWIAVRRHVSVGIHSHGSGRKKLWFDVCCKWRKDPDVADEVRSRKPDDIVHVFVFAVGKGHHGTKGTTAAKLGVELENGNGAKFYITGIEVFD